MYVTVSFESLCSAVEKPMFLRPTVHSAVFFLDRQDLHKFALRGTGAHVGACCGHGCYVQRHGYSAASRLVSLRRTFNAVVSSVGSEK